MINSLQIDVLNIYIHEISEKDVKLSQKKNSIFYLTYKKSMVHLAFIVVETPRIGSECSLVKKFITLISLNT